MMRTLRDMNMSKFVAEDVPLFLSLIEDLFPGLKADRAQFPDISSALEKVAFVPYLGSCLACNIHTCCEPSALKHVDVSNA